MGLLILTFGLTLGLSFAVLFRATRPVRQTRSVQQRLVAIQQPARSRKVDTAGDELEKAQQRDYAARLGRFLQNYRFSRSLQVLILQADSTQSVGSVVIACAGAGTAGALLAFLLTRTGWLAALALAAGAFAPYAMLRLQRSRRLKAFNSALPDAIDLLARALRAGHSMSSAIELVAEQSPAPLGTEFAQVYQQQKFGLRFREALVQMTGRIPSRDLQFLVTAILVQKETGGDLTEILDRTSHVIRERVRIEGEVRTHTAQGRLTGWILGLLPVIMLLLINIVSPGYSTLLFHDPTGQKMLYAGAALILVGGMVIRKVVDVQV